MVFLPVCVFQFTRPRTFSPYIFNAKTLTQQLNTLPANIPFFVYPPHLSSLILIINVALPFPSIVYLPHLSSLILIINAALPFPSIVYPPHLSSLILIINAALPFPFNPLSSALIQPDTYHQIAINS